MIKEMIELFRGKFDSYALTYHIDDPYELAEPYVGKQPSMELKDDHLVYGDFKLLYNDVTSIHIELGCMALSFNEGVFVIFSQIPE